ncbi:hypothetical protein PanWU01x14_166510 [Parasponia andersonii]|uniref:Uncharacterized protein n=1 Tax=Parasponia andersonii TaxID=3476 RepID=A0A2P5CBK4_PARAD|nr:hypothetical protein PanWU01x14_166510 [Parasponia andersonii]
MNLFDLSGGSSTMECEGQISELESILDSQIYPVEDKTKMKAIKVSLESAPNTQEDCEVFRESFMQCKSFVEEVLSSWGIAYAWL